MGMGPDERRDYDERRRGSAGKLLTNVLVEQEPGKTERAVGDAWGSREL